MAGGGAALTRRVTGSVAVVLIGLDRSVAAPRDRGRRPARALPAPVPQQYREDVVIMITVARWAGPTMMIMRGNGDRDQAPVVTDARGHGILTSLTSSAHGGHRQR